MNYGITIKYILTKFYFEVWTNFNPCEIKPPDEEKNNLLVLEGKSTSVRNSKSIKSSKDENVIKLVLPNEKDNKSLIYAIFHFEK